MAGDVKASSKQDSQATTGYRAALANAQQQYNDFGGQQAAAQGSLMGSQYSGAGLAGQQQNLRDQVNKAQESLNNQIQMEASGRNADGSYVRPDWQSNLDDTTGMLKSPYVLGKGFNGEDVNTQGLNQFRQEALRTQGTDSLWAKNMMDQNRLNAEKQINTSAATQNAGLAGAYDSMAATGGIGSGSRERIAQNSLRDLVRGRQDIHGTQTAADASTRTQDEGNRINNLKSLPGMEIAQGQYNLQNDQAKLQVEQSNINNALTERQAQRNDSMDAWKKNQDVWASNKQADAQKQSSGGGGGCCFIFLEARYGNGTMDAVVRKFRDEHMTVQNKRGYYKLSEVLVPLMRKSRVAKFLTRALITDPLVSYGKYHYGEGKIGVIFTPVKNFWLKAFDYLGQDHEFVRENGETV